MREYLNILSWNTLGLFIISFLFRFVFRINTTTRLVINYGNRIAGSSDITLIGNGTNLLLSLLSNNGIYINTSHNGVFLDKSIFVASGVKIISANHNIEQLAGHPTDAPAIKIEQNSWLGANSVILPGVHLGPNTIVGAGAVVTKSFSAGNLVLAGVPARIIKQR